jgi:hypothetical protein
MLPPDSIDVWLSLGIPGASSYGSFNGDGRQNSSVGEHMSQSCLTVAIAFTRTTTFA